MNSRWFQFTAAIVYAPALRYVVGIGPRSA
jgi:hypothetical protein